MMSENTDKIIKSLSLYGLSYELAITYLNINQNVKSTALKISKEIDISRTKVYAILDKLIELGLVEQVLDSRGFKFITTPDGLNNLLIKEKNRLNEMELQLPTINKELDYLLGDKTKQNANVKYYKGIEGLKQVTWNSLKAQKTLYIYEMVSNMSDFLDPAFSEEVRTELVKRRIHVKQLTNFKKISAHTKVTALVTNYWEPRYIDSKKLNLSYEVLIYNDVVAMYSVKGKNLFCIETHDVDLAKMQKNLFNFVWESAVKMNKVGEYGEAHILC